MPDQEMTAAVDALEAALIVIVEDAHELAVACVPETGKSRRERVSALRQIGTDIAVVAESCAVLLRRAGWPNLLPFSVDPGLSGSSMGRPFRPTRG